VTWIVRAEKKKKLVILQRQQHQVDTRPTLLFRPTSTHLIMDDTSSQATSSRPGLARDPSSHGGGRPRGILKNLNAEGTSQAEAGVRWDEVNLNLNEVEKEATTRMQINEPK
jgi:hypothetical protein